MQFREKLNEYMIGPEAGLMEALRKIDANRQGFLIVTDREALVLGALTDGDIRRGLLKGRSAEDTVEAFCTKHAKTVAVTDDFERVTELFKSPAIKFLPITDEEGQLANIITKRQFHSLLLQDIRADLTYDFFSLDESVVDYEIFRRPWGFYKTTVLNDFYQSKVISVKPGGQLSLQSHDRREEHWIVVHGRGTVEIDRSTIEVACGSSLFIPKGAKHRLINRDPEESLIVTEVQIGDYLGEDDIVRYEDMYGRT